jgi:hypothetical protein
MRLPGEQFAQGPLLNIIGDIVDGIVGGHAASTAAGVQNNQAQSNAQQIKQTAATVNPLITGTAQTAGSDVESAAGSAAANAGTAAQYGGSQVTGTAATGGAGVTTAANTANAGLNPYSSAGATAAGQLQQIAANGNQQPTLAQLQISPAYQFQLQQGENALNYSAAAQGGAVSGGNIEATEAFAQGMAGTAYQNAFSDFETAQQNNVANLQGIANSGQVAATTEGANTTGAAALTANTANTAAQYAAGNNLQATEYGGTANMNASQYAGTANIGAADTAAANTINAQNTASQYQQVGANDVAAGIIGKADAYTGAVTGATNQLTSLATGGLSSLLNPIAAPGTFNQTPASLDPIDFG